MAVGVPVILGGEIVAAAREVRRVTVVEGQLEQRDRFAFPEPVPGPVGKEEVVALPHAPETGQLGAGDDSPPPGLPERLHLRLIGHPASDGALRRLVFRVPPMGGVAVEVEGIHSQSLGLDVIQQGLEGFQRVSVAEPGEIDAAELGRVVVGCVLVEDVGHDEELDGTPQGVDLLLQPAGRRPSPGHRRLFSQVLLPAGRRPLSCRPLGVKEGDRETRGLEAADVLQHLRVVLRVPLDEPVFNPREEPFQARFGGRAIAQGGQGTGGLHVPPVGLGHVHVVLFPVEDPKSPPRVAQTVQRGLPVQGDPGVPARIVIHADGRVPPGVDDCVGRTAARHQSDQGQAVFGSKKAGERHRAGRVGPDHVSGTPGRHQVGRRARIQGQRVQVQDLPDRVLAPGLRHLDVKPAVPVQRQIAPQYGVGFFPSAQPDPIAFKFALPVLFRSLPGCILAAHGAWTVLLRRTGSPDLDAGRLRSPRGSGFRTVVDRERQVPVDAERQFAAFQLEPVPRLPDRTPTTGGEQEEEENRKLEECVADVHGITSVPWQHASRSVASAPLRGRGDF